jgi:hypothetical protein
MKDIETLFTLKVTDENIWVYLFIGSKGAEASVFVPP